LTLVSSLPAFPFGTGGWRPTDLTQEKPEASLLPPWGRLPGQGRSPRPVPPATLWLLLTWPSTFS
jgi:hypothetical protein